MASEATEFSEASSLIERLINSRNRDIAMFLPFILALTNAPGRANNPEQESSNPGEGTDRIILINPLTQGMIVIEGGGDGGSSLDLLMRDLLNKDGQPPASKDSIEAMPVVEIETEEDCVICLEEWEIGGKAKQMPCKHRFHGECIEKWLNIHGSCPVCRYKMPVEKYFEKSKINDENNSGNGIGRRREIWVSFSFANHSSNSSVDSSSSNPLSSPTVDLDQNTES